MFYLDVGLFLRYSLYQRRRRKIAPDKLLKGTRASKDGTMQSDNTLLTGEHFLYSVNAYSRHLRKFSGWLVREPGYRSKVKLNTVDYLKVKACTGTTRQRASLLKPARFCV